MLSSHRTKTFADLEPSNGSSSLSHNGLGGNPLGAGGDHEYSARKTTSRMASPNKTPSLSHPEDGFSLDRAGPVDAQDSIINPRSGKSEQTQDSLLQVPEGGNSGTSKQPVETSIWDWDTPLESLGDSSSTSYYYEPQGELLQEQREQRSMRGDFSIPHPVGGPGLNWPSQSSNDASGNDGFVVPRRPTGGPVATAGVKRKSQSDQSSGAARQADKRVSRRMSESGEDPLSPSESRISTHNSRSQSGTSNTRGRGGAEGAESHNGSRPQLTDVESLRPAFSSGIGTRRTASDTAVPMVLPARKVFPIQIGDKLFRLSGASISSDAPSYFSQFFEEQLRQNEGADNVRTLYVDRDPQTFQDIALHLQGYHIEPRDGPHFVKLFADAQFFSLPRLTAQLFSSTIYIKIGDEEFQIPRDLFNNPGDSPNYFSLGFSIFFTTPNDAFPGLTERTLLRPPSILPPSVPNKSARTFADLLHMLKGYPVDIRSEAHRQELLRDARYFHLKGLEQRLLPHRISYNLARKRSEILIRLEDIRQSGISFVADNASTAGSAAPSPASSTASSTAAGPGWVFYQRPYVDSEAYNLIVEMAGEENTFLSVDPAPSSSATARICRATFFKQTLSRITSLFSVIASKMNLPVTQPLGLMMLERGAGVASLPVSPSNTGMSEEKVKVRIGPDADVVLDGKPWTVGGDTEDDDESSMDVESATGRASRANTGGRRRKRGAEDEDEGEEWVVKKSQWRLRVQPSGGVQSGRSGMEIILGAVKIEAFSNERSRNAGISFLT